jgi:hypothetical protein
VARGIDVVEQPTTPLVALAGVVGAVLVAANLVAAVPARIVRRTRAAGALRTP